MDNNIKNKIAKILLEGRNDFDRISEDTVNVKKNINITINSFLPLSVQTENPDISETPDPDTLE